MDKLVEDMKVALASTFAMYLKAHNFHWNVEGPHFAEYHSFFGELYGELWGAVDGIAEQIRALDAYAPGSLGRFAELSVVKDQVNIPAPNLMFKELVVDNAKIIILLESINEQAGNLRKSGLSNFIEDRIDKHSKHGWMLRSISKGV